MECPLCCETMSKIDMKYPLHCPTASCRFQFCCTCLQRLTKSAADGYTESSDGSNQVKIALQCPQCRGEYVNKKQEFIKATNIVHACLRLREAALIFASKSVPDSEMSATELSQRRRFLQETCNVKILQDDLALLQDYHASIQGKDCGVLPPLDWEEIRANFELAQLQAPNLHSEAIDSADLVLPRDPTLFLGLEDLMTSDEQEFITSMLVSGHAETLAQASNLLQNITSVSMGKISVRTIQELAFAGHSNMNGNHLNQPIRPSKAQLEHQHRVRQRFPLPTHMPRSVTLPVFDHLQSRPCLEFDQTHEKKGIPALTLSAVRGPAGKEALRKGDIVTHVNGESVSTVAEFIASLQRIAEEDSFQLTVNANDETALALRSRAQTMKKEGIRFH